MVWSVVVSAPIYAVGGEVVLACGILLYLALSFLTPPIMRWFAQSSGLLRFFAICSFVFCLGVWFCLWTPVQWAVGVIILGLSWALSPSVVSILTIVLGISAAFVPFNGSGSLSGLSDLSGSFTSSGTTMLTNLGYSLGIAATRTSLESRHPERRLVRTDLAWSFVSEFTLITFLEDDLEPLFEVSQGSLRELSESYIRQSREMVSLRMTLRERYAVMRDGLLPKWIEHTQSLIEGGGIDRSRVRPMHEGVIMAERLSEFEAKHTMCKLIFAELVVNDSNGDGDGLAALLESEIADFKKEVQAELGQRKAQSGSLPWLAQPLLFQSDFTDSDEENLRNAEARLTEAAEKIQIIKDTYGPDPCLAEVFAQMKRDWYAFVGDNEILTISRLEMLKEMWLGWPALPTVHH